MSQRLLLKRAGAISKSNVFALSYTVPRIVLFAISLARGTTCDVVRGCALLLLVQRVFFTCHVSPRSRRRRRRRRMTVAVRAFAAPAVICDSSARVRYM